MYCRNARADLIAAIYGDEHQYYHHDCQAEDERNWSGPRSWSYKHETSPAVVFIVVTISPPAIRRFVSHAKAATVSVSIAVLKGCDRPHPSLITASGFLQSSHIDVTRVIFAPFVLTFAVPVAIAVLKSVSVGLLCTTSGVILVVVPVVCRSTTAECHGCGE